MLDRSSVKSRFVRGTEGSTRPKSQINHREKGQKTRRSTCKETDKVLHGYFVTSVIYFDVIPIQIEALSWVGVYVAREFVTVVASCVIRKHEDNIGVRDTETFYCSIPEDRLLNKCWRRILFDGLHSKSIGHMLSAWGQYSIYRGCGVHVRAYAIVKPVPRCTDEDSPIVGMIAIVVFIEEITSLFFVVGLSVS